MSVEITVPQLGESIVEATVGQWRKGEGDAVTAGEPLVELETDKVNVEVAAPSDGIGLGKSDGQRSNFIWTMQQSMCMGSATGMVKSIIWYRFPCSKYGSRRAMAPQLVAKAQPHE